VLGLNMLDESLTLLAQNDQPWPGEIVVFGHWLWAGDMTPTPEFAWPRLPAAAECNEESARELLDHPAFAGWAWNLPDLTILLGSKDAPALEKDGALHQRVAAMLVDANNGPALSKRLLQQARWLTLSKERDLAAQTLAVRQAVEQGQADHPFISILAWRSLLTAAADRAMRHALKSISRNA